MDNGDVMDKCIDEMLEDVRKKDKEIKRLHKVLIWWRAVAWRFVKHHSKTIEEAEEKMQNFEKDCMMGKEENGAFKQALKKG